MNGVAACAFHSVGIFSSFRFPLAYIVCMEGILGRTCEVQVIDGVDDDAHKGEVECSNLCSDLRFNTAVV